MRPSLALVVAAVACALCVTYASARADEESETPQLPYTVNLWLDKGLKYNRQCTGIRLTKQWLVTAAECVDPKKHDKATITYSAQGNEGYKTVSVDLGTPSVKIHPGYSAVTKTHNIALVRANMELNGEGTLPRLPSKDSTYSKRAATVSAFLKTRVAATEDFLETHYNTEVIEPTECKKLYLNAVKTITDKHICSSVTSRRMRLSEHEVGAGLVLDDGVTVVGIASSIKAPTKLVLIPNAFTKVAEYADWIRSETGMY